MVKPIELAKSEVSDKPYLVWNALIQLITESNHEDLNEIQSIPLFAFWYDSEIQNGGHLQYFENKLKLFRNKEQLFVDTTMEALNILGAKEQNKILSDASKKYLSQIRKHPSKVKEFCELALEDEFGEFDRLYYKCSPDMNSFLENYLQTHLNEFVKLI